MGEQNKGLQLMVAQLQCVVPSNSRGHLTYRVGESVKTTSETKRRHPLEKPRALTRNVEFICTEAHYKCNETTFDVAGTTVLCSL